MRKKTLKQSGFGVIEVLVSLSLLTVVVISLGYVSRVATKAWESASNRTIAYNLIQESFEQLRFQREENIYNGRDYNDGMTNSSETVSIGEGSGRKFKKDLSFYKESANIAGQSVNEGRTKVQLTISWNETSGNKKIEATTYFTDWKPKY